MFHIVAGLKSKYATLAAARVLLVSVLVEVLFTLGFLLLYLHVGGYGLEELADASQAGWLALALPPLGAALFLYALFEAKRAPFDHSEAESELVAGHLVEFGGRALLLFYLCEYTHMYLCLFLVLVLCGGAAEPLGGLWAGGFWADAPLRWGA
jgi:NADH-quinone oxidoreductase subunit H